MKYWPCKTLLASFSFFVIFFMFSMAFCWSFVFEDGLVAYYSFYEGKGNTVNDLSGNGYTGRISGARWIDGKIGKALYFNGNDNFVDLGTSTNFCLEEFTLMAWLKSSSNSDGYSGILTLYSDANTNPCGVELSVVPNDSRLLLKLLRKPKTDLISNSYYTPSNWHHLAVSKSRSNVLIYLDGVLKERLNFSGGLDWNCSYTPRTVIGSLRDANRVYAPFKGIIDEVKIYNRAISEDELQRSMVTPSRTMKKATKDSSSTEVKRMLPKENYSPSKNLRGADEASSMLDIILKSLIDFSKQNHRVSIAKHGLLSNNFLESFIGKPIVLKNIKVDPNDAQYLFELTASMDNFTEMKQCGFTKIQPLEGIWRKPHYNVHTGQLILSTKVVLNFPAIESYKFSMDVLIDDHVNFYGTIKEIFFRRYPWNHSPDQQMVVKIDLQSFEIIKHIP